jgi:hypothetical protein
MDHQRDARRAQDEILDEEYRRQKAEEAIQRDEEVCRQEDHCRPLTFYMQRWKNVGNDKKSWRNKKKRTG